MAQPPNLLVVDGDLMTAPEELLVHQCCCTAVRAHGLSAAVAARFPHADPYAARAPMGSRNMAIPEHRPAPGTLLVLGDGSEGKRRVVALFGQVAMGKPGRYDAGGVPDAPADRLRYFRAGMAALAALRPASLALPWRIGCGLAGGDWRAYWAELAAFAAAHPAVRVALYRLPGTAA
jgi:hypothetical protein